MKIFLFIYLFHFGTPIKPLPDSATLIVHRKPYKYNILRKAPIYVNNILEATLAYDETKTIRITAGKTEVMTKDIRKMRLAVDVQKDKLYVIEYSYNFFYLGKPRLKLASIMNDYIRP